MNEFYDLLYLINQHGKIAGPRGKKTKELEDEKLVIDNYNFMSTPIIRPYEFVYKYWYAETCWYLSGNPNVQPILSYSKFWAHIANPDGTANSNYGNLIFYKNNSHGLTMFDHAVRALATDKDSRRAMVLYADPDYIYPENNDFICTQGQHFKIRNDELNCTVFLRSSDFIYGQYFNIPWWSLVQQQMYLRLKIFYPKLQLGKILVHISSAHYYEPHFELVEKILDSEQQKFFIRWNSLVPFAQSFEWYQENLKNYFSVEKIN